VPCVTLAGILRSNGLERVDLLKMDCEGAEYEIFYEAPASCFEAIREIRMEYHNLPDPRCNVTDLTAFFLERGYTITRSEPTPGNPSIGNLWARR
jgi:hypothetical protein